MNIFDYAMQMEKDGEAYYRQMAGQTDNKGMRKILTMLAEDEVRHYQMIEQMKTRAPDGLETTILTDVKNVFAGFQESGEKVGIEPEQGELYAKAREIEKKSMEFYREKGAEVEEEYQKQAFRDLAEEEHKHYIILDNIIEFISRPESWLEDAEFSHLDEY
jgi:rubrerythrin